MLFMRASNLDSRTIIATSLALVLLLLTMHAPDAHAQRRRTIKSFQGVWEWAIYPRSRRELPPAYRNSPLRDVPRTYISLGLSQIGDELGGVVSAGQRFLAKIEDSDLPTTKIKNNVARVTLESGHGGKVTATITLRNNRIYWKIIEQEGEHYFPPEAVLRRTSKTVEF